MSGHRPGNKSGNRRKPLSLSPAHKSASLLIRIAPQSVGLFRFLLEGYDNLALFTVIDPRQASLKLLFSPHEQSRIKSALAAMQECVAFEVLPWPWS